MKVTLTKIDRETLISWGPDSYKEDDSAKIQFPEEYALLKHIEKFDDGEIELNYNQLVLILSWAENRIDHDFGSGASTNYEEANLLKKIKNAFEILQKKEGVDNEQRKGDPLAHTIVHEKDAVKAAGSGFYKYVIVILIILLPSIILIYPKKRTIQNIIVDDVLPTESQIYKVKNLIGNVFVKSNGKWIKVRMDLPLAKGDTIRTEKESQLFINVNGSEYTVVENTTIFLP